MRGELEKKTRKPRQNPAVREYILRNIERFPADIATITAAQNGLSRTAVNSYIKRLIAEGLVEATGKTKARRYSLAIISANQATIPLVPGIAEDAVFRTRIKPHMKDLPENVAQMIAHGFMEIFNNAIDHSGSPVARVMYEQTYARVRIAISDDGIGIFEKIQRDCGFDDPRTALLELSKGKLTTDARRHSGEGIFFTSRMFSEFMILSGQLAYATRRNDDWGWLTETESIHDHQKGTSVSMMISTDASWTAKDVFNQFEGAEDDNGLRPFAKTHVPIKLGKYGNEQLISRSQAKRLLARFDRFSEIMLDFEGVLEIGQAFADEIFRVFANQHRDIKLTAINATSDINRMIQRVRANGLNPVD